MRGWARIMGPHEGVASMLPASGACLSGHHTCMLRLQCWLQVAGSAKRSLNGHARSVSSEPPPRRIVLPDLSGKWIKVRLATCSVHSSNSTLQSAAVTHHWSPTAVRLQLSYTAQGSAYEHSTSIAHGSHAFNSHCLRHCSICLLARLPAQLLARLLQHDQNL
jgi:hypothetical protein